MVYGRKQTSTLQTHFPNAVPLVWGSLRLAPNIYTKLCNISREFQLYDIRLWSSEATSIMCKNDLTYLVDIIPVLVNWLMSW